MLVQSRSRLAVLGFITDLGGMIALTILGLISAPIILKLTSQSLYGFWITTISILGYLALTDLGLGISLIRFIASVSQSGDSKALNGIISTGFFTFCGISIIFIIIGISIAPFIPVWFKIPPNESAIVLSAYIVAIFTGAIAFPLSVFKATIVGFQKMAVNNLTSSIISLISIGLSLLLLFKGVGIVALPLSNLFSILVNGSFDYFYARHYFPSLKIRVANFNFEDFKKLLSFGGLFQLGRVANTVALSTDSIIISGFMGAIHVTPYVLTSKLPIMFSVTLASKLPIAIFPALTDMFACNEIDKIKQIYKRLFFFSIRLSILAGFFIFIANQQFITLWVGLTYFSGNYLNIIFVILALLDVIYRSTTAVVYASGDLRTWSMVAVFEAGLNIIISIILVSPLGLVGVALGTLISKTITTGFYTPLWICRKINLPVMELLKDSVFVPFAKSIPSISITYLLAYYLPLNLGWIWIIIIGIVLSISNILLFEGLVLFKPSHESLKIRLRKLILMQETY